MTLQLTSIFGVFSLKRNVSQEFMMKKDKISLCSREVTLAQQFSLKKALPS
jgi:hypothetical protein